MGWFKGLFSIMPPDGIKGEDGHIYPFGTPWFVTDPKAFKEHCDRMDEWARDKGYPVPSPIEQKMARMEALLKYGNLWEPLD